MNIVLKGFDDSCGKTILENAFRGLQIGTCISILNDKKQWPDIRTQEHIWMPAKPLREGRYPTVKWHDITPLDEETVTALRPCETVFLTMAERYARYADMSFEERERQYKEHLRYWNHLLRTKDIGLVLMNTVPHQCYDWVIWCLCKHLRIPVLYLARYFMVDAFSVEEEWERVGWEAGERFKKLKEEDADDRSPVHLSPYFESFFTAYTQVNADPWYMFRRDKHLEHPDFMRKWTGTAVRILIRKPAYFLRSISSPDFWSRKWRQHRTTQLYDRLARIPDLKKPFIYVPLHMQPEATTCPMGGAYCDQELLVQMLARHLPEGWHLYVKEHPAQGETCRSEEFYRALASAPHVTLVPRHFSTFALRDGAITVASVTGTAGFEALFREKPALIFGHQFYQYAPGVFRIRTAEECVQAIRMIALKKKSHTLRDMRLYLKAIEGTCRPYAGAPESPLLPMTKEEKAVGMGNVIAQRIQQYFR